MSLEGWARKWNVPMEALRELADALTTSASGAGAEAQVINLVRVQASESGWRVFRNNVGACYDQTGRFIRYGLANESERMNKSLKSSDLVGIRPVTIDATYLGRTIGQFVALECKRPGWHYTGTLREQAQQRFLMLVEACGGYGRFTTGGL